MLNFTPTSKFRTLLVLGRVSNLPTVWSNCAAGWLLAGGGKWASLIFVSVAVSFLYIGGMFLNDAFDVGFDYNHRPTRPIPSGAITQREVWLWGFGWMILGVVGLMCLGQTTAILGLSLALAILIYNLIHKIMIIAPVIMGGCRVLVYLIAASVGVTGVTGESVWKGLALGSYIVGLSCLARKETSKVRIQYWPCTLLAGPIIIAWLLDDGADARAAVACSVAVILWAAWTILQTLGREHPNVGRAVARLLAGIALVDLLAVANCPLPVAAVFIGCFLLALTLQRYVPAT